MAEIDDPRVQAALEAIATEKPDIVFLDIRMPVLDGVSALRRLRRRPEGHAVKAAAVLLVLGRNRSMLQPI